jgi:predicted MFS family arabinose efflux permease
VKEYRSKASFAILVVSLALFVDTCIYGIIVPVMPFALYDRFGISRSEVTARTSYLVAFYAAGLIVSTVISATFGRVVRSAKVKMLVGLLFLACSTVLLTVAKKYSELIVARIWQGQNISLRSNTYSERDLL